MTCNTGTTVQIFNLIRAGCQTGLPKATKAANQPINHACKCGVLEREKQPYSVLEEVINNCWEDQCHPGEITFNIKTK